VLRPETETEMISSAIIPERFALRSTWLFDLSGMKIETLFPVWFRQT
jgi:hypothetical protein